MQYILENILKNKVFALSISTIYMEKMHKKIGKNRKKSTLHGKK
jgi:hypothetical protein